MKRNAWRSVGALFAGALASIVLSIGTDVVLYTARVFPPFGQPMVDGLLLLATAYRAVYGVVGSYIAARLAPDRPMTHALALGVVGLAVSIVGAVVTWGGGLGPHWYPLALVALTMPQAWAGGQLRRMQARASIG